MTWPIRSIMVSALLFLVACAPTEAQIQAAIEQTATAEAEEACSQTALMAYADDIEELVMTFEQQALLTSSTPRASIGTPLQRLLDIQTETRRIDTPECLEPFQEHVVSMMAVHRLAYETFAVQGDETLIEASLQVGGESLERIKDNIETLKIGEIPPEPTPIPEITPEE